MVGQLFQQNKSIIFIFLYLKSYVRVYLLTKIKYSFFFFFNGMTSQIHKLGVLQYFE